MNTKETKTQLKGGKGAGTALFLALLLVSGCAGRRAAVSMIQDLPSAQCIAVLPFDSADPQVSGPAISDYFTVQILQRIPELHVIERKDLMKILQERKLALTGVVAPDRFSKIGAILGVNAILVGTIHPIEEISGVGGSISVTIKLMEIPTGRILWADHQQVTHATWSMREVAEVADSIMQKTAEKMVRKMGKGMNIQTFARRSNRDEVSLIASGAR